jgi:hypothetical protein
MSPLTRRASAASQGRRRSSAASRRVSIPSQFIDQPQDWPYFDENIDFGFLDTNFPNVTPGFENSNFDGAPTSVAPHYSDYNPNFDFSPQSDLPNIDANAAHGSFPNGSGIDPQLLNFSGNPGLFAMPSDHHQQQPIYPDPTLNQYLLPYSGNPHMYDIQEEEELLPTTFPEEAPIFRTSGSPAARKRVFSQASDPEPLVAKKRRLNTQSPKNGSPLFATESASRSSRSASSRSRTISSDHTDASARRRLDTHRKKNLQMYHRGSAIATTLFPPEKPKATDDRPWVRVNATTQGLSTRTSKINNYTAQYEQRPHPVGAWTSSSGNVFQYTDKGEFSEKKYTAREIEDFILNYPKGIEGAKLTLWIQKCPTDSARRYETPSWSKCRFKDCPANLYQTGTILHGHYRVAFDEKWYKYGENVDPFLTAGYAHLYCMERFLDFPRICRHANVEVDNRHLSREPRARFAGSLNGQVEGAVAETFVDAAKQRKLHKVAQFAEYPEHRHFKHGEPKPHTKTLTYAMCKIKAEHRPRAQLKQFADRNVKDTHIIKNLGDLEMLFSEVIKQKKDVKKAKAKAKTGKGKKRKAAVADLPDLDEEVDAETKQRNEEFQEFMNEKLRAAPKRPKQQRRVKKMLGNTYVELEDYETDSEDDDGLSVHSDNSEGEFYDPSRPAPTPTRSSKRLANKGPRTNYSLSPTEEAHPLIPRGRKRKTFSPSPEPEVPEGYQPTMQFSIGEDGAPELPQAWIEEFMDEEALREALQRRRSTLGGAIGLRSRGPSVLKSAASSRPSTGHRISFGGATTHFFDKDAAPRRHSRRLSYVSSKEDTADRGQMKTRSHK